MKYLLAAVAIALLADDPMESEIKGDWIVVSLSFKGVPKELKSTREMAIDEKHIKQSNDPRQWDGYTLNSSTTPKQIDLANGQKGIYELNGDNLKICHGKERPKDFDTGVLIMLKRKK